MDVCFLTFRSKLLSRKIFKGVWEEEQWPASSMNVVALLRRVHTVLEKKFVMTVMVRVKSKKNHVQKCNQTRKATGNEVVVVHASPKWRSCRGSQSPSAFNSGIDTNHAGQTLGEKQHQIREFLPDRYRQTPANEQSDKNEDEEPKDG